MRKPKQQEAPVAAHPTETPRARDGLWRFIAESNRIEGIRRAVTAREYAAHKKLLDAPALTVRLLREFVWEIARAPIRDSVGMNVRVGGHWPPPGGPHVVVALDVLLQEIAANQWTSFEAHCHYETLHPFMDGNGRSGRAIWLWMANGHAPLGFLHTFYYQALSAVGRP